jgi:hypothetical protein
VQIDGHGHSQCTFTFALPAGQVVIETGYSAGINGNKKTHEPIVGGTGKYSRARGYAPGEETGRNSQDWVVAAVGRSCSARSSSGRAPSRSAMLRASAIASVGS